LVAAIAQESVEVGLLFTLPVPHKSKRRAKQFETQSMQVMLKKPEVSFHSYSNAALAVFLRRELMQQASQLIEGFWLQLDSYQPTVAISSKMSQLLS